MISVRAPVLLDASLNERARLSPVSGSLTLKLLGSSEATLTLPEDAPTVSVHDWIELYTARGSAGVFRVSNVAQNYTKQVDVTLLHGIDILADSVWRAQTTFTGTMTQYLTALLDQQTQLIGGLKPWVLGTCADTSTVEREINYDRLSELLEDLEVEGGAYYFTFDQSHFPWTLNYVALPAGTACEFRLTRNIRSATVTFNDADLCTRLIAAVNVPVTTVDPSDATNTMTTTETVLRTYDNAAAQAVWGVVTKTADIETSDDIAGQSFPEADAWAADFLAKRAAPTVQIQVDGDELAAHTGESWDEYAIGRLCQVALPDYGHTFSERVVSVTWPQLYKDPDNVDVSLANALPQFTESLTDARKQADRAARTARGAARSASNNAKRAKYWENIVEYYGEALDGSGVMTLYQSGITMDAVDGVHIWSLSEGLQALYSGIKVNRTNITSEVSRASTAEGQLSTRITQTADAITSVVTQAGVASETFSESKAYAKGAKVLYNGVAYEFTAAHPAGPWTGSDARQISSLQSQITQTSEAIAAKVSKGDVSTQLEIECGNVHITGTPGAANLTVDGYITATELNTRFASFDTVTGDFNVTGDLVVGGELSFDRAMIPEADGEEHEVTSRWYVQNYTQDAVTSFGTPTYPTGQSYDVSIPFYTLGTPAGSQNPAGSINFSIANTAKYRADVGIASSGSINTSSAWTNDGEGGGYYKPIRATAKNGSYADATVSLPTITVDGALNSATATAELRAYGPAISGTAYAVSVAKNLYLKLSGNTVYLTNANATPVISGTSQNTLAMLDVSGVYNSGWDNAAVSMGMGAASSEAEYNSWTTGYTPVTVSYGTGYRVYITKSDGQSVAGVKFIVPPKGSISGITLRSSSVFDQSSNYYVIYPRATGSNLSNANNRYDTSLSFDASAAVNYGVGTVSNAISIGSALSSEPSADVNGGTLSADSWYLVTATASNGASKTLKLKTPVAGGTTYNEGWDALIAACQGSNASSYVQYSGASSVSSSPDKQAQKIDGYVWLKNSSGTWVRTRNIPISHTPSATNVRSEYSNASGLYTFVSGSYVRLSNNKAYIFNA